ncbi:thioredoxin-like protein [Xylariaceae sp. FL1272]|nr:thioredoxin-like protein [Xylariaceae sp. FL1272]
MFRFRKSLDIVTLFHKASSPASVRAATVLKQASANASEAATEDQASDHSHQTNPHRPEFDLNITEEPPTADQLKTILEYVGQSKIGTIVQGASNENEAMKKFKESSDSLKYPVIVDWNNGKAIATDKESEILKMLDQMKSK